VLVTTPGLPALKNLRLMLDTLDLLGTDDAARAIVLNQVGDKAGLQRAEVEEILGRPVAAVIPASPDVAASIDVGTPLLGRRRDTAVATAVRAFVSETFVGVPTPAGRRPLRLGPKTRKRSS
jgi:pilus assembly protein CpaE